MCCKTTSARWRMEWRASCRRLRKLSGVWSNRWTWTRKDLIATSSSEALQNGRIAKATLCKTMDRDTRSMLDWAYPTYDVLILRSGLIELTNFLIFRKPRRSIECHWRLFTWRGKLINGNNGWRGHTRKKAINWARPNLLMSFGLVLSRQNVKILMKLYPEWSRSGPFENTRRNLST